MEKLYSKITCKIIDQVIVHDESQQGENDCVCDMNDTQATICQILEKHREGNYILVITDSQVICNLVLAINPTLKDHKLSVFCNGQLYAEEAVTELERLEKILHTDTGSEYFPEYPIETGMFVSENGDILLNCYSEAEKFGMSLENLYNSEGNIWGFLLPFKADALIGKLQTHTDNLTFSEKCKVALAAIESFKEGYLTDSPYLFKTEHNIALQSIGGNYITSTKELYFLLYELFFANTPMKDRLQSLVDDRMKHTDYPGCLFEFFELAFADRIYPGLSEYSVATVDFLENTINRMAYITKEV